MNRFLTLLATLACGFCLPTFGVENPAPAPAPAVQQHSCCNTVCPICGKAVDIKVPTFQYVKTHGPKHHELVGAVVGFDSEECHTKFVADPGKYEETVWVGWQEAKKQLVK